jgi:hypothetical protein
VGGQAREQDSVRVNGYAGTIQANSQDPSSQAREEDAVSVNVCAGTLQANSQDASGPAQGGGCGACECVRRYTTSKESGHEWPGPGRRMR